MVGKIAAASLTLSIGGSGGVFAPSLFTGAMAGMAFGLIVQDLFGPIVSSPAIFGVAAMGAVFGAAAQAPLTAIASVVEMTGNFTLTVPVMLAVGIATAISKRLSYGSIYTTKLLRRGVDIERPKPTNVLQVLTVADVMLPLPADSSLHRGLQEHDGRSATGKGTEELARVAGPVTDVRQPQVLFANETLDHALRQLVLYGHAGLPVVSDDGEHLRGWITRQAVLRALADRVESFESESERGELAAEFAEQDAVSRLHIPRTPLTGYDIAEVSIRADSPAAGRRIGDVVWPPGSSAVAVTEGRELVSARSDVVLRAGERVIVLVPAGDSEPHTSERESPSETAAASPRIVPDVEDS